jgi:hypothetical protein
MFILHHTVRLPWRGTQICNDVGWYVIIIPCTEEADEFQWDFLAEIYFNCLERDGRGL